MIVEEDDEDFNEYESNHSSKDSYRRKQAVKSHSDWDESRLGNSENGN